jgi:hypothetical protein
LPVVLIVEPPDPPAPLSVFLAGVEESPHPGTANIAMAAHASHIRGVSKVEPSLLEFMYVLQNCSEQRQPPD